MLLSNDKDVYIQSGRQVGIEKFKQNQGYWRQVHEIKHEKGTPEVLCIF